MREDWELVKLGEFATHEKGKKPRSQQPEKDDVFKFPYINIEAFEKGVIRTYTDGEKCCFCFDDDFLMVWDGSRSGLVGKGVGGALGSTLVRINFFGIVNDYAYYFLSSKYQNINTRAKGSGTPHVDPYLLWNYQLPIPPLPEQRAIVAKIEELFSDLDKGIADLKKAQAQLKIYRQAVLKKAFEGALSKVELREVIDNIKAGKSFRCEERPPIESEVGVLKVSAVTWGKFQENESKTVTDPTRVNPDFFVKKGDFLFSRANTIELVGNSVIVKSIDKQLMLSDKTLRITFHDNVSPYYILYFLRSRSGRIQIENLSTGNQVSMRNIGQERIKQIKIPFPSSLEEQHQIVREIETRLSVCDQVEQTITESLEKAQALRQSILKKAFAGLLLSAAEIAACKAAPDYEPASVLLANIQAEKAIKQTTVVSAKKAAKK